MQKQKKSIKRKIGENLIALAIAISLLIAGIYVFGLFLTFFNVPMSQNVNNLANENYVCWNEYNNTIKVSSIITPLNTFFNKTKYADSIQQNFILTSKTNNSVLWYQYVYNINKNYFELQVWNNAKTTSYYIYSQFPSKTPKYIVLNNTLINNNQTIKINFIMTDPNQTFTYYLNIPKNYQLYENKTYGNKYGYYNTFNFELDFNKTPNNYPLADVSGFQYSIDGLTRTFSFNTCEET